MANSLVIGSSSLSPCYRGGILLTTLHCPFLLSEPFQGQTVPSTSTLPPRKCNLTAPRHRSQCTLSTDWILFSSCPPSGLTPKLRESWGTLCNHSAPRGKSKDDLTAQTMASSSGPRAPAGSWLSLESYKAYALAH